MPFLIRSDLNTAAGEGLFQGCVKPFLRNEEGAILPILAALMIAATAGAALSVDIARAYAVRSGLQTAADSAALAAAVMLPDLSAAKQAAENAISKNLAASQVLLKPEDLEFGYWHAESRSIIKDDGSASAVRVTVQLDEVRGNGLSSLFAGILGNDVINVAASAVAGKRGVSCLLALNSSGKGLELNGQAKLHLKGCGAQINSTGKEAFKAGGHSQVISDGICVSGGAKVDTQADIFPAPTEYCPPQVDPMQGLVLPEVAPCIQEKREYKDKTITLSSGHVFCKGLKIKGNSRVMLKPGLYIVNNGKLELDDTSVLEGDGVTIMLYGEKAELDIKGSAALRLNAPTDGPMKGLLIVQSDGSQKDNKWDSDAVSELTGVVYLPDGKFTSEVEANLTGTDACFVLIAGEIKVDGHGNMMIDLSSTYCRNSLPTAFSRSVALLD